MTRGKPFRKGAWRLPVSARAPAQSLAPESIHQSTGVLIPLAIGHGSREVALGWTNRAEHRSPNPKGVQIVRSASAAKKRSASA
jgi:hypothetical protein